MTDSGITKEYLETILKEPVEKFEVKAGSSLGDGYTCAMFSVDVWKRSSPSVPLNILIKCFPTSASRQEILDQGNSFKFELGTYDTIIPKLIQFQKDITQDDVIQPPFPDFIYGNYIPPEERAKLGRPLKPIENCIVMPDLRHPSNGAYRLRDRFLGLDLDHYSLVIEAHAKFHALSWAYKCKKGVTDFEVEFPFLKVPEAVIKDMMTMMEPVVQGSLQMGKNYMKGNEKAMAGLDRLGTVMNSVLGLYMNFDYGQKEKGHTKDNVLRVPGPVVENEEPWNVLLHGDSWSNNMLFRYDEKTGRPVQVLLIDLQMVRQGDPFCDICYTLYASGAPYIRRQHLESLLHIYYDTFESVCHKLDVPLLPGWSWEEVNRRFHRAKMIGAFFTAMGLPIMLKDPNEIKNLDESAAKLEDKSKSSMESAGEFFANLSLSTRDNPILAARLGAVMEELSDAGVV